MRDLKNTHVVLLCLVQEQAKKGQVHPSFLRRNDPCFQTVVGMESFQFCVCYKGNEKRLDKCQFVIHRSPLECIPVVCFAIFFFPMEILGTFGSIHITLVHNHCVAQPPWITVVTDTLTNGPQTPSSALPPNVLHILSPHSTRLAATMAVTPAYASSICRALLNLTHLPLAPSFVEKLMEQIEG